MENEITLQFPTIVELIEFEAVLMHHDCIINRSQLTLIGNFPDAEIELAKRAFNAKVIDNTAPKNQLS